MGPWKWFKENWNKDTRDVTIGGKHIDADLGDVSDAAREKASAIADMAREKVEETKEAYSHIRGLQKDEGKWAAAKEVPSAFRESQGMMAKTGVAAAAGGVALGAGYGAVKGVVKAPFKLASMINKGVNAVNPYLFWPYLLLAALIHLTDWGMRFPRKDILLFYTDQMLMFHIAFAVLFWIVFFRDREASITENLRILGGLIFVAFIAYLFPLISTIVPQFFKIQAVNIALNPIIHPIWIYFGLITFKQSRWAGRLLTLLVLFWTFFVIFNFMAYGDGFGKSTLNPGDYQNIFELGKAWWEGAQNFARTIVTGVGTGVQQGWNQTMIMAAGDYYTGQVDQNAKAKLGVYLEDIKESAPDFYDDEPVSVWATMKAQTLDKTVPIKVQCYTYNSSMKPITSRADPPRIKGKLTPREDFYVYDYDEEDIECFFDRLPKGRQSVGFQADFDFETQAYYRTYFMDINRMRSYKMEDIDILKQFGISDTDPTAIYTNGPVMIGMKVNKPPVGIGTLQVQTDAGNTQYTTDRLSLRMTIDNNWEGKITSINDMMIMIPKGMRLDYNANGQFYCDNFILDQTGCGTLNLGEGCDEKLNNVYRLRLNNSQEATTTTLTASAGQEIKPRQEVNIDRYLHINCPIFIESTQDVLSQNPITARYFKVLIDYGYSLSKETTVDIKDSATTTGESGNIALESEKQRMKIVFNQNLTKESFLARSTALGGDYQKSVETNISPTIYDKASEQNINPYLIKAIIMNSQWNENKIASDNLHYGIMQISQDALSQSGKSCDETYKTNAIAGVNCGTDMLRAIVNYINQSNKPLVVNYVLASYYSGVSAIEDSSECAGKKKFECEKEPIYYSTQQFINEVNRLYDNIPI